MTAVGSVMGLVVGGALTEVSWRLAFLVNVPIGLVMMYLARTALRETNRERMKLDATGAVLATLACTAAVFAFSMGPEKGWISLTTISSGVVALGAALAFVIVERTAENPVVPFDLFRDRNRLVTFIAIFLAGGVMFTLTVCIGLYVQDILGYSALRAGVGFIPFVIAMGIGLGVSSQLVARFSPRVLTIAGGYLLVLAMLYGWWCMHRGVPYFPNLVLPIVVGGIGIGMAVVPLTLSAIAGVGFDQIGPVSAVTLMLQSLGGPLVLAVIQAVITSRTLYLGGTTGPVKTMNDAQLQALDHGYTYGLLWVAGAAVIVVPRRCSSATHPSRSRTPRRSRKRWTPGSSDPAQWLRRNQFRDFRRPVIGRVSGGVVHQAVPSAQRAPSDPSEAPRSLHEPKCRPMHARRRDGTRMDTTDDTIRIRFATEDDWQAVYANQAGAYGVSVDPADVEAWKRRVDLKTSWSPRTSPIRRGRPWSVPRCATSCGSPCRAAPP